MSEPEANKPPDYRDSASDGVILLKSELDRLKEQQQEEKRRENRYRSLQLMFNIILGIASVFTLGAIWYQGYIMRRTLTETHTIAQATQDQARAAADNAASASASASIAKASLESSQSAFEAEERAYLWDSSFNMSNPPTCQIPGGTRICADVHISNTGRTPAIGVRIFRNATFGPNAERTIKAMKIPSYTVPSGDMLGTTGDKWGTAPTPVVDDKTARDILEGRVSIYVYGVAQYFDVFGEYHETGFCSYRLPANGPFISCPYGNWFDKRTNQK